FKDIIEEGLLLLGAVDVGDYLSLLNWLDLHGLKSAMKKLQKKRDAFLQKLVKDHREKLGFQPKDLIDLLISAAENHEIQCDSNDDVVKATAIVKTGTISELGEVAIMTFQAAGIVVVFALAALFLILNKRRTRSGNGKKKPPHPPSWPIIGHLHLLQQKRPIHRILSSLSESYGPIMHLQLGFRPLLVISSSDLAKQCFTTNDKAFASRPRLSGGKHMGYDYKNFAQAPYGSYWRNLRKMCTLHIFSATRIESFKQVRVEEISALIRSLFDSCQREVTPANIKSRLSDLTFNIMLRMVANKKLSGAVYSEDFQEARHFKDIIEEAFLLVGAFDVGDYLPFLNWLDLQGLKSAMKKLQKKRDAFLQKLLKDHREKRGFQPKDLIDVLISATDNQEIQSDSNDDVVKATALSMISAGTDTSSVTIEWALAALLQNPEFLRKAQQELDAHIGRERVIEEADLQELKYLQAIVKETLRLYPAGPLLVPHKSTEDCSVGGYHVPAGTRLL
ncbi:hypothetical protein KI387_011587, partial [Taxus chinensis]